MKESEDNTEIEDADSSEATEIVIEEITLTKDDNADDMNAVMKKNFFGLVNELREKGIDLQESPALFKWTYPEQPKLVFKLLIQETSKVEQAIEEKQEDESLIVH